METLWEVASNGVRESREFYLTNHFDIGMKHGLSDNERYFVLQHGGELHLLFALLKFNTQVEAHPESAVRDVLPSFPCLAPNYEIHREVGDLIDFNGSHEIPTVRDASEVRDSRKVMIGIPGANFHKGYYGVLTLDQRLAFVDVKGSMADFDVSFQREEILMAIPALFNAYLSRGLNKPASDLQYLLEEYFKKES